MEPVRFRGRVDDARRVPTAAAKNVEPDDPYELVGVRFPVAPGTDPDRELARCVIEEFALMGWPPERIRQLYVAGQYQGTRDVARRRGMAFVEELLAEVFVREPGAE